MTQNETAAPSRAAAGEWRFDAMEVFASAGEVPYEWLVTSDTLRWGANVREVLHIADPAMVASGRAFAKLLDADNVQSRFDAVMRASERDTGSGVPYHLQYALRPQPGTTLKLWIEDVGRWFAGGDGKPVRAMGVIRVINERRALEERLAYLSRYDELTGQANRWHLTEILGQTLDEALRYRSSCGFLLVAIDHLGRVNETYGYDVADEVIAAIARRLRAKMRGGDTLGRFCGNKFGIILQNCTLDEIGVAADRLLASVHGDVIPTRSGPVATTITIGGVSAPRHARTVQDVFSRAQEALQMARKRRRGSFQLYRPNVEREAIRRQNARASDDIVRALNDRRVRLAYEPVVWASTRMPAFFECLLRVWRADGGMVAAQEIVPLAERLGLIRLLDQRMTELVIEQLAAVPNLELSLNVSPVSTVDPDWWRNLTARLAAHPGVAPRLIVEITESAAIQDLHDTRGFVSRVKDLGIRIAIDDFGAGYTSFRNLRTLGADIVKIDGAFVQNLTRSADDRAFVHTLIDLAKRLGLQTVAEWVQDEPAATMLTEWGCDCLQGALFGLATVQPLWGQQSSAA